MKRFLLVLMVVGWGLSVPLAYGASTSPGTGPGGGGGGGVGGGTGDVDAVGNCTSGTCFTTLGTGSWLDSNTDFTIGLDADNDATNSLIVTDGLDATVFSVTEAGLLTAIGGLYTVGAGAYIQIEANDPCVRLGDNGFAGGEARLCAKAATDNDAFWQITNESGTNDTRVGMLGVETDGAGASILYLGGAAAEGSAPSNAITVSEAGVMGVIGNGTIAATTAANIANNTGATTTVLHGNAAGAPSFGAVVSADITDGTVALADMADLAQDKFIVRTTASTGVPETATVTAAARTVLDDVSVGAMLTTMGGAAAADVAAYTSGAGTPVGAAACTTAGDLYRESTPDPDVLWLCTVAGSPGTWTPIGRTGPGCTTGTCFTDTSLTTGTTAMIWEGTASDANQWNLELPANPTTVSSLTIPDATAAITMASGTGTLEKTNDTAHVSNTMTYGTGTFTTMVFDASVADPTMTLSDGNSACTGTSLPYACCTGAGTGTCEKIAWTNIGAFDLPSGALATADVASHSKSIRFPINELLTDGTNCEAPAAVTVGSGPKVWAIKCPTTGGIIYGNTILPDSFVTAGTLVVRLMAIDEAATPAGTYTIAVDAQCVAQYLPFSNTFGTSQSIGFTLGSFAQGWVMVASTAAITPNNTCAAKNMLVWRATVDTTATTDEASVYIIGSLVEYTGRVAD